MAGLEPLISLIYHERQQPGSMLCAQHALNNLLQGNYFTAPDLSSIASSLDALEGSYHTDAAAGPSTNMDDTGFFSVQVLENALNVWGLNLVRWRSADMRPFQDRPHEQLGFILNLEQHWFTLRRFGQTASIGESHWFNLNSFLESPEWVSKTYLGMVLQQAETEGYSVFVITEEHEGAFPRTEADHLASTLREPSSASGARLSTSRTADPASKMEGFEDEDMELQAALQASLMGGAADELLVPEARTGATSDSGLGLQLGAGQSASIPLRGPARTGSTPGSGTRTPTSRMPGQFSGRTDEDEDLFGGEEESGLGGGSADPVEASMARNRAIMERMQREQEMALRASYQEEDPEQQSQAAARRRQREEEEEEMLRRAIEESRALHEASTAARAQDRDDDDMEVEEVLPRVTSQAAPSWNPSEHRVYDDDDAELQAALRASLEQMPEGFQIPEESPAQHPDPSLSRTSQPPSAATAQHSSTAEGEDDSELESEADTSSVAETPAEEQLSMEEIRRRRLARFGG